jgi:hypothetical protein
MDTDEVAGIVRQVSRASGRECLAISAAQPQTLPPLLDKAGLLLARDLNDMSAVGNDRHGVEEIEPLVESK